MAEQFLTLMADLDRGALHALFLRAGARESLSLGGRVLGNDELKLIVTAPSDPAPDLPVIPIERLQGVPMCLLRSDDMWGYNESLVKECQRWGFSPRIVCQCYDTPMAMQLVQAGFGVSFLPESIVKTMPRSGIYAKSIEGLKKPFSVVLAWDQNAYHAASVEHFLHFQEKGQNP